jgi:DNA-binding Xre family transcriptional regulator
MISYQPFWEMMQKKNISTYALEYEYGLNKSEIHRLKHDHNFNIFFIDHLCSLFDCEIEDVVIHCSISNVNSTKD